jgi:predicted aspartyl protease
LPFLKIRGKDDKIYRFLVDTGASLSAIKPEYIVEKFKKKSKPFIVKTLHGQSIIDDYVEAPILKGFGIPEKIKLFVVPILREHDGILGYPAIKQLQFLINFRTNTIFSKNTKFPFYDSGKKINNSYVNRIEVGQESEIEKVLQKHHRIQLQQDEKLTANTRIKAEIKTFSDEPVYTHYPIPFNMRPVAERLIEEMLENKITRPSKSPYNSPIKIVEKKTNQSAEKKYRLTVNFKKLNSQIVPDRYPVPNIEEILAQLGGKNFFTTLDLVQGFYQIHIREEDISKTAFSGPTGKYI